MKIHYRNNVRTRTSRLMFNIFYVDWWLFNQKINLLPFTCASFLMTTPVPRNGRLRLSRTSLHMVQFWSRDGTRHDNNVFMVRTIECVGRRTNHIMRHVVLCILWSSFQWKGDALDSVVNVLFFHLISKLLPNGQWWSLHHNLTSFRIHLCWLGCRRKFTTAKSLMLLAEKRCSSVRQNRHLFIAFTML